MICTHKPANLQERGSSRRSDCFSEGYCYLVSLSSGEQSEAVPDRPKEHPVPIAHSSAESSFQRIPVRVPPQVRSVIMKLHKRAGSDAFGSCNAYGEGA